MQNETLAYLLLEDGTYFIGKSIGIEGTTIGEICFNTGMTGYQEVFSDPSYTGQVLIMTNTHIGNYGTTSEDTESNTAKIKGLVVKRFSRKYSRIKAEGSLQKYLVDNNIVGITDIDTRELVIHIRNKGAMNCIISNSITNKEALQNELEKAPSMKGLELASVVSSKGTYKLGNPESKYRVAVLDLGIKSNILNCMIERDYYLKVFPAKTPFSEMEKFKPNGYFLSNGPGDPSVADYAIETTKNILKANKPIFGICFGHQIIALANNISTYKMHNGHRGLNHPVINVKTGLCEITSQNHGFVISKEDVEKNKNVEITHIHLNDQTVAGIKIKNKKAFSVQYHPESSPGPQDSRYLFDEFTELMA